MTQQSLITRLRAVEEALEYAEHRLASSQPEIARDTRTHISEPLSDLRELIKEEEGRESIAEVIVPDNPDYPWVFGRNPSVIAEPGFYKLYPSTREQP